MLHVGHLHTSDGSNSRTGWTPAYALATSAFLDDVCALGGSGSGKNNALQRGTHSVRHGSDSRTGSTSAHVPATSAFLGKYSTVFHPGSREDRHLTEKDSIDAAIHSSKCGGVVEPEGASDEQLCGDISVWRYHRKRRGGVPVGRPESAMDCEPLKPMSQSETILAVSSSRRRASARSSRPLERQFVWGPTVVCYALC
ncbi:unnamed protein product [Hermetia illucens]|uniref:Uncharacterized protein n=1 Tax=Hermetia illucens TaxID=343691 RepID=A0A7R8UL59_HERIL|nr:uncharacterized protein LOC119648512 [Hermetia illucens]CAD7082057.1 unnamed protein product [Hermetia illucens]